MEQEIEIVYGESDYQDILKSVKTVNEIATAMGTTYYVAKIREEKEKKVK